MYPADIVMCFSLPFSERKYVLLQWHDYCDDGTAAWLPCNVTRLSDTFSVVEVTPREPVDDTCPSIFLSRALILPCMGPLPKPMGGGNQQLAVSLEFELQYCG